MRISRSAVPESTRTSPPTTSRRGRARRRWTAALVVVVAGAVTLTGTAGPALADRGHDQDKDNAFTQTNLASDLSNVGAKVVDDKLKNPWGIAFGPVATPTPLWTSNQASNSSTLYTGTTHDNAAKAGLEVAASSPTGIVFNTTTDFVVTNGAVTGPARFIFDEVTFSQQGIPSSQITGWVNTSTPNPQTTVNMVNKPNAFYSGLALVPAQGKKSGPVLLAADNANPNTIDVYDGQFKKVTPSRGYFKDPTYSKKPLFAYGVAYLDGRVYVSYAPPPGAEGTTAVSVFTPDGKFRKRLVTGDQLAGPWGMAIAPKGWGDFGGDLLVGNVDDGKINAFNPRSGNFRGTIEGSDGKPLVNLGLWGIEFGNNLIGTPNSLVFAAGIGITTPTGPAEVYQHGLVGLIEPVDNNIHNN
jgi:uncharacterized protein (TIGR03118 family)